MSLESCTHLADKEYQYQDLQQGIDLHLCMWYSERVLRGKSTQEDKLPESKTHLGTLSRQGRAYMLAASRGSRSLRRRLQEQLQLSRKRILVGMAGTCYVPCWCSMR